MPNPTSKTMLWIGWILSVLPCLMLVFSASGKFMKPKPVLEGFEHLGWPISLALPLGIVELSCVVLFLIPRTCVLGAILLTGYMGGAMATHIRLGEPWFIQCGLGVVAWLGLYFRDARIRDLIPLRR